MRRHDYTKTSLIVSLACMTLFGGYVVGVKPPEASSFRSPEAENSRIVEGSKVALEYVATVPDSPEIDHGNVSEFIQGRYEIVRVLEQAIVGMKSGEENMVELSPEEGFGTYDAEKKNNCSKNSSAARSERGSYRAECFGRLRYCGRSIGHDG